MKDGKMKAYVEKVRELETKFQEMKTEQISRESNWKAGFLAKIGRYLLDCRERKSQ